MEELKGLVNDLIQQSATEHRQLGGDDFHDHDVSTAYTLEKAHAEIHEIKASADTFWLLYCGTIVFLMQAGFAMLEGGSLREKNIKNIMLKNILDPAVGGLGFYLFGFGLSYGNASGENCFTLIGDDYFFLGGKFEEEQNYHGFFFQFVFAATAATIVSGAVAERCQMIAYAGYSFFLTAFVYPVVVHMIWSTNGYMVAWPNSGCTPFLDVGVVDFAGCGVVHMVGGVAALWGAAVLGPRAGRFDPLTGEIQDPMPPHNTALVVLGTFILWFGWYGFNPGSTLTIASDVVAAKSAVTTTMSACGGAVTNLIIHKILTGVLSLEETCNGVLAGLVGITSACSVVDTGVAFACGCGGAIFCTLGAKINLKMRIDDPVNASGVHFYAGMWGLLAPALFANAADMSNAYSLPNQGVFYGDASMLAPQAAAIGFVVVWTSVCMCPFFVILRVLGLFRVPLEVEMAGMDASEHGGGAYNIDKK
jgi:Amt family ammonium transporter